MIDLTTSGRPINLTRALVGRVTRTSLPYSHRSDHVLVADNAAAGSLEGYRGVLTTASINATPIPGIHSVRQLSHLADGDIVAMHLNGGVRTLFRPSSQHNALLVTERCNSFCLMCSQPPIDRDDSELTALNIEAVRLMEPRPATLGITGGEPTLLGEDLFLLFRSMRECLPDTDIHMLTNGRRFAWRDFTAQFVESRHPRLTLGVPIYADNAPDHDYVVQAKGAFDQTIVGLHELARYEQPIEIRVVLHALTIPRLNQLAEYIYRNLPFAEHVTFMGLEITGFTRPNLNMLWIDPYDYRSELAAAVEHLANRGMNVSIYNHPLCVLPQQLWRFARKSISDWKNQYFDVCEKCSVREQCGGFFKSATLKHSVYLRAVTTG